MSSMYEASFRWPYLDAFNVIVTGSFDSWSRSHYLSRSPSGYFKGSVQIPWGEKVTYKYIVDGRWTTTDDQPTELDPMGNLNNVMRAPAAPAPAPAPEPAPVPVVKKEEPKPEPTPAPADAPGFVETARRAAVNMVEAIAPGTAMTPVQTPSVETPTAGPEAAPEPVPAPPEVEATVEASAAAVPSEPTVVAPIVPVPIVSLGAAPEPTVEAAAPADVIEDKQTVVEETTTAPTAEPEVIVAPVVADELPSTHLPATAEAVVESATDDVAPAEDKAATVTSTEDRGTTIASESTKADEPKPEKVEEKTPPTKNGVDPKYATVGSSSKKMRFPSFSSRHSRARSSLESGTTAFTSGGLGEIPEKAAVPSAEKSSPKNGANGRLASTQRSKRRSSFFDRLKGVFVHKKEVAA
ncbi:uncharacterized protein BXZ73DRAFT_97081 [Epithele typhae]|uniref:uncharacterized protein n=1 Tax=Epithele typhae TaxID=378194 RepID=UPI0020072896|nr:uncharacterized protein BXZ73DRAFT_97081 [Epithele typhae]KAH9943015.1 hypothetical protein BXZ73DRAFT_97081 [Epithele typhae]